MTPAFRPRFLLLCVLSLPVLAAGPVAAPEPAPAAAAPPAASSTPAATPEPDAEAEPVSDTPAEAETLEDAHYIEVANPAFPALPREVAPAPRRPYAPADLATYFPPGPLGDARAAFDKGAYTKVLQLTEKDRSLPVRFLRAQASLKLRDNKSAAQELTELAQAYPALADRCLLGAAAAREALGQLDQAAQLLAQVPVYSRNWMEARLNLARLMVQQKQRAQAVEVLQPLTEMAASGGGRDFGAEALWTLADLAHKDGKKAQEKEALVRIWARHPLSGYAAKAQARLGSGAMPPEAIVDRAEGLVEAHRNKQGMQLLEPLNATLKIPNPLACRAQFVLGKALRKEREHTKAMHVLEPVAAQCNQEIRPRALYLLGTSQAIVAQEQGIKTYEVLAQDFPDHPFADDALFYAADLELKAGRPERALEQIVALVGRYPLGDFAAEALFKAFWIERGLGHLKEALIQLDAIEQRYADADESYDVERARYWRARMAEEAKTLPLAVQQMASLVKDHPSTYYGLRAREWLERNDPAQLTALLPSLHFSTVTAAGDWPLDAGPLESDPHFKAGVELLKLGFEDWADPELLAVKRAQLPTEPVRLLVRLISLAGDAKSAHGIARASLRRDLAGPVTPATRPIWEIAYPNAFRPLIEKHCKSAGLDPDLLQALMREESALDPHALSWAGALGLTQLMPSTARQVAKGLKLRVPATAKLLEPDLNIRLGAAYLGQLLRRFAGNPSYALASYNAGAASVDKWRAAAPELPLDAWVEEIPLAETRGYVKRVLRSYNTYRLLYGVLPEPPPLQTATKTAATAPRR